MLVRGRAPLVLLALAVLVGIQAAPVSAAESAAPGFDPSNPIPLPGAFSVRGSNGYTISVFADSDRGRSRVLVSAVGRSGRVSVSAPADLSGEGIRADLGRYGSLDMAWRPSGQAEEGKTRCRTAPPAPIWFAGGEYVGTFSFHGEDKFTEIEVGNVDGREGWWRYASCGYWVSEGYPGPGILLEAQRTTNRSAPSAYRYLSVVQNRGGGEVSFAAELGEQHGDLRVGRSAYTLARHGALRVAKDLGRAEVRPPSPFHGLGVFDRIAKRGPGTWRGNLAVDFPGRPGVSLAGQKWTASLVRGFREIVRERLSRTCLAPSDTVAVSAC